MNTKARRMRELLTSGQLIVSPGVYDGYSARLAEVMGYKTASTTGSGMANALLAEPDIGIMSMLENARACHQLARAISIPLMADADTGYGNAISAYHTVEYFEEAGVVGLNIEDQSWPKRCGHMKGKELIEPMEMAAKIEAACKARKDPDFVICARTDAIAVEGIDAAIERARLYARAGADILFPDAVRDEGQIARFVDEVGIPISINMGFGIRSRPTTPLIPVKRLQAIGVARISLPRMLTAAAIAGMRQALALMTQSVETGEVIDRPDLLAGIEEITSLVGYRKIEALEAEFLQEDQLQRKYGTAAPSYVVPENPTPNRH
jgi:2-methylisocitrate lyase-like PEP mutase family enzyme